MAIVKPPKKQFIWQTASDKIQDTPLYHLDWAQTNEVWVKDWRGIIDIENFSGLGEPAPAFASSRILKITGPLVATNVENFYIQITPYYSATLANDNVIPYILPSGGALPGVSDLTVYNANPAVAGANNWTGRFYLYYELGVNFKGK